MGGVGGEGRPERVGYEERVGAEGGPGAALEYDAFDGDFDGGMNAFTWGGFFFLPFILLMHIIDRQCLEQEQQSPQQIRPYMRIKHYIGLD